MNDNVVTLNPRPTVEVPDEVQAALDELCTRHTKENFNGVILIGFREGSPTLCYGGSLPVFTAMGMLDHVKTIIHETMLADI